MCKLQKEIILKKPKTVSLLNMGLVSVICFSQLPFLFDGMIIFLHTSTHSFDDIQLSPEGEVNSGGYTPRREASRYISSTLHRP